MRFKPVKYSLFIITLLISNIAFAEVPDESSILYMGYLGMKSQIDFFKEYFNGDEKYLSQVAEAEQDFIKKNPLYLEIGNKPPANAEFLKSENQRVHASAQEYMKRDIAKIPKDALCSSFCQTLRSLSFESMIEDSKRRFDKYKEKASKNP